MTLRSWLLVVPGLRDIEPLRNPFEQLLHMCQPRLRRRRVRLDDIDLVVQRLNLRQLHGAPPFVTLLGPRVAAAASVRIRISADCRSGVIPEHWPSRPSCSPNVNDAVNLVFGLALIAFGSWRGRRNGGPHAGHQLFEIERALRCRRESSGSTEHVRTRVTNDNLALAALPVTR